MTQVPVAIRALLIVAMTLSSAIAWSAIPDQYQGHFAVKRCTVDGEPGTNLCARGKTTSIVIGKDRVTACKGAVALERCAFGDKNHLGSLEVPLPGMYAAGAMVKVHSGGRFWVNIIENPRFSRSFLVQEFGQKLLKLTIKEECSEQSELCAGTGGFTEVWLER